MDNSYCINYHQTKAFGKIFLDYVDEHPALQAFYQHVPNVGSIKAAIELKSSENINRNLLVERLTHQYNTIETTALVTENIQSLKNTNTYTITTGHQLSIYTGEWYSIFKIITAINMAKEAKLLFPEFNFVPVFWMASEDHDFEEINHVNFREEKFEWKRKSSGPTGRLLVDDLVAMNASLAHFLNGYEFTEELISIFNKAYVKGRNLADATRVLINELFKEDGLVVIDADDVELKKSWSNSIRKELTSTANYEACSAASKKLEELNYPTQILPREINLFYILDGYRERIIKENEHYFTKDKAYTFSSSEILEELNNHPERFSPNVVLRPLYQESILPNLAYIGGPGEIAYWLQLKTVFENNQVAYPILAWRNSFMLMNKKDMHTWKKLGFEMANIFNSGIELEKEYVVKHRSEKINLEEEKEQLQNFLTSIKTKLISVDSNLQYSLIGTQKRIENMMQRLEQKIWKAEKKKFKLELSQIEKIKTNYFPNGKLQERNDNFSFWYASCGIQGMKRLKEESKVLQKEFKILVF
jgi:bacillithiol biosynthesis cysteine-adding enzyme BshC